MFAGGVCVIGEEYKDLFLQALDEMEEKIQDDVKERIDNLGLGPLGLSFSEDILNVKEDVFDSLFPPADRDAWFDDVNEVDLEAKLQAELILGGSLEVNCGLETNPERLEFGLIFKSSVIAVTLPVEVSSSSIAVLPDPLPVLDLDVDDPMIEYNLTLPFVISLDANQVSLGEVKVNVDASIDASISQDLPILLNDEAVTFVGTISAFVSFDYSSYSQLTYDGSYLLDASVDASSTNTVANLALTAHDDNFFDSKPPIVNFDFDLCDVQQNLLGAISSFSLANVLDTLLDSYFDLSNNDILQPEIVDAIKSALLDVSNVETKVDNVKQNIVNAITAIPCQTRRALRSGRIIEVTGTGDVKRDLSPTETFSALTNQIEAFAFVSSASAGYFAARNEISVDVGLAVSEVFNKTSFRSALSNVFGNLQGQDLFGGDNNADIDAILAAVDASALFTAALSFGLKVGDIGSILSNTGTLPIDGLFLRVDDVSVNVKIAAEGLSQQIFNGISIDDGALDIMAGIELVEPFELDLAVNGDLQNGISFANTVKSK